MNSNLFNLDPSELTKKVELEILEKFQSQTIPIINNPFKNEFEDYFYLVTN